MKRILSVLFIAFSILCLIILINTLSLKSESIDITPIDKLKIGDDAINRLSGAIKFKTISSGNPEDNFDDEFYKLHNYLEGVFPLIHSSLEKKIFNQSLLYKWTGTDKKLKPILLMSHLDVVPVVVSDVMLLPMTITLFFKVTLK